MLSDLNSGLYGRPPGTLPETTKLCKLTFHFPLELYVFFIVYVNIILVFTRDLASVDIYNKVNVI